MPEKAVMKYRGDIVAGSLLVAESRQIADLLLRQADDDAWHQAIVVENILQKRSPVAAKRQARLIKHRLLQVEPALWKMIKTGSADLATQATLAATIKYDHLLGDFMDTVIRQHWQTFTPKISAKDWADYLKACAQIDPDIDEWSDSTKAKIRQVVFRVLTEAGYIDNTRSLTLTPVSIIPEIRQYLTSHQDDYVLRCMDVTQ